MVGWGIFCLRKKAINFCLFWPLFSLPLVMMEWMNTAAAAEVNQKWDVASEEKERKIASKRRKQKSFEQSENFLDESVLLLLPFFVLLKMWAEFEKRNRISWVHNFNCSFLLPNCFSPLKSLVITKRVREWVTTSITTLVFDWFPFCSYFFSYY